MSNLIISSKYIVSLRIPTVTGPYYPIFCTKSCDFAPILDSIEVTTVNSPNSREYEAGLGSGEVNITGIATIDNSNNRVSPLYLMQESVRRELQDVRILLTAEDNTVQAITFQALIVANNLTKDVNTWAQCSVKMLLSGGYVIDDPVAGPATVDFDILSDWWTTTPGSDYVDVGNQASAVASKAYTLTATDEVLLVSRSTAVFNIITTTPGNAQAKFDTSTLLVNVDSTNPFFAGETVFIVFKRPI